MKVGKDYIWGHYHIKNPSKKNGYTGRVDIFNKQDVLATEKLKEFKEWMGGYKQKDYLLKWCKKNER